MNKLLNTVLKLSIFLFVLAGTAGLAGSASAQPACGVTICKVAPQLPFPPVSQDDFVFFPFEEHRGSEVFPFELAANSRCTGSGLEENESAQIVELPLEGWNLADIECYSASGLDVSFIENGAVFSCNAQGAFITCTFVNVRESAIPTLSEWGMISAVAGLALIGVFFAVRRKRTALSS